VAILFIGSCSKKENAAVFAEKIYQVQGSVFLTEDKLLDPWNILLIDSVLIIANNKGIPLIETYDLSGKPLQKILSPGAGPEEILSIGNLQSIDNDLYVYGVFDRKFLKYEYSKLINAEITKPDSVLIFSFIAQDTSFIINTLYINPTFLLAENKLLESRIRLFDFNGGIIRQGGSYPANMDDNLPDYEHAHLYTSDIAINKERTKIALASYNAGLIEIYDIKKTPARVFAYSDFAPHGYIIVEMGGVKRSALTGEAQYGYADIATSGKYIYAIYSGKTSREKNFSYGNIIRVLDWDGKERYEINTDMNINRLTVSANDEFIYAIAKEDNEGEPVIVRFDISGIKK
jgi:hypothetical protein